MEQFINFDACEILSEFIISATIFTCTYPEYDVWYVVGQMVRALKKRNTLNVYHLWEDFEDRELATKFETFCMTD